MTTSRRLLLWTALALSAATVRAGDALPYVVPTDIPILDALDAPASRKDHAGRLRIALERGVALVAEARAAQARSGLPYPPMFFDNVDRVLDAARQLSLASSGAADNADFPRIVDGLEIFVNHLARRLNLLMEWRDRDRHAADLRDRPLWTRYETRLRAEIDHETAQIAESIEGRDLDAPAELRRREQLDALYRLRVEVAALDARLTAVTAFDAPVGTIPTPAVEAALYQRFAESFEAAAAAETALLEDPRDVPERITSLARPGPADALRIWRRYFDTVGTLIRAGAVAAHPDRAADPDDIQWRRAVVAAADHAAALPAGPDAAAQLERLEAEAARLGTTLQDRARGLAFLRDAEDLRKRLDAALAQAPGGWAAFAPARDARAGLDAWVLVLAAPSGDPLFSAKAEGERIRLGLLLDAVEMEAEWREREADFRASDDKMVAALKEARAYASEALAVALRQAELSARELLAAAQRRQYDDEAAQWEAEREAKYEQRMAEILGPGALDRFPWLAP